MLLARQVPETPKGGISMYTMTCDRKQFVSINGFDSEVKNVTCVSGIFVRSVAISDLHK